MNKLNEIVKQMLEEHEGGEIFFDAVDNEIRNNDDILYHFLYKYVKEKMWKYNIIMSGRFGRAMVNSTDIKWLCDEIYQTDCILVNGSLRKGDKVEDFKTQVDEMKEFIFLDDSFYSGKTRDAVRDKLESYGCKLVETIVLYDGSKVKDDTVTSMYRYYG